MTDDQEKALQELAKAGQEMGEWDGAQQASAPQVAHWQYREFHGENTVTPGWSDWKEVKPRNLHTDSVDDRVKELMSYIAAGYRYELRPLYAVPQAAAPSVQVVLALESLVRYVERNECQHEETHRGGAIWTICDGCGKQWADDRGGFEPYKAPAALEAARAALAQASALPAAVTREFTNELGNRIKITVEGPSSVSENILTPMEAAELRSALNEAALPAAQQPAAKPGAPSLAARDVLAERRRQVEKEGWTPEHDDEHGADDLALAAACYALPETDRQVFPRKDMRDVGRSAGESILIYDDVLCPHLWPWHGAWWKPKTRREDLVRAGALIIAEIERLDRAALATPTPPSPSDAQEQQP